jgi:hypothetical protein
MLQRLQRRAFGRAFGSGGSRTWFVIGTAAWLLRTANRLRKPVPELVYQGKLEPGQALLVEHLATDQSGRPTRRSRRRH